MRSMIIFQGLMSYLFCDVENQEEYSIHNILRSSEREHLPEAACSALFQWPDSWKQVETSDGYRIKGFSAVSGSTYALSSFLSFLKPELELIEDKDTSARQNEALAKR